jgi:hypothetical protein
VREVQAACLFARLRSAPCSTGLSLSVRSRYDAEVGEHGVVQGHLARNNDPPSAVVVDDAPPAFVAGQLRAIVEVPAVAQGHPDRPGPRGVQSRFA